MKLKKKWEVAKVGKWNDFPITEDILKDIEKNNASMTAPIRPGHTEIKSGQKCEGSLTNPVFEDGSVVFDIELKEGLAESWQNGEYINWSMDLKKYPDIGWAVSGLALLGAESPGIKGLQEIEYSETSVNKPVVFRNDDKSEMTLLFSEKPKETFSQIEIDLKDVLKYIKKTTLDDKVKIVTAVTGSIKEDDKKAIREMAWFKEFNENNNNNKRIRRLKSWRKRLKMIGKNSLMKKNKLNLMISYNLIQLLSRRIKRKMRIINHLLKRLKRCRLFMKKRKLHRKNLAKL